MGIQTITIDPEYSPTIPPHGSPQRAVTPDPAPSLPPDGGDQAASIMDVIARAARDPNVDIDKMERLLEMQERILQRDAIIQFNEALAAAQAEMEPIVRDAPNDQTNSRYAKLETIVEKITPIRARHGFSVSFTTAECDKPDHVRIIGELLHTGGYSKVYTDDYPLDLTGIKGTQNKTKIHAHGSTITYGRRYLTCMMFDLAIKDEDDDGNASDAATARTAAISPQQRNMLEKRLQDAGGDLAKFCSYMKVDDLAVLPAARMNEALNLIEAKQARKKEPAHV